MLRPEHLTEAEVEEIFALFTVARDHLRLNHWNIILMMEPCDDATVMDITPCENHPTAQLRVGEDWSLQRDQIKRDSVVHELLHLLHRDVGDVFEDATLGNTAVSADVSGLLHRRWYLAIERMVSHLSFIICDHMKWPSSVKRGAGLYVQGEHR